MLILRSRIHVAACFIIFLVCIQFAEPKPAQADTGIELQKQVHRLQWWMGMGPNAQNWRNYLKLSILETQVVRGNAADIAQLEVVQTQFKSGVAGLNHPVFRAVAVALDRHISRLKAAAATNLEEAFANARFVAIDKAKIDGIRKRAKHELLLLASYYRSSMPQQAPQILKDMEIEKLNELISREFETNVEVEAVRRSLLTYFTELTQTGRKFRIDYGVGRNDAFYPIARDAVDQYLFILRAVIQRPTYQGRFANDIAGLKQDIENLANDRSRAKTAGYRLEQLESAGQVPVLAALIRQKFSQPNFYFSVSESVVNQLAGRNVNETMPVDEIILGRQINGTATTLGKVQIDFVNDPHQAHISLRLRGQTISDSYTKEGPITAFSKSYAEVEARRSVLANIGGLNEFDSYVAACLRSTFTGTNSLRIVTRIAERQFRKDQDKFERVGAYRAEIKLKQQFDNQTNDVLINGKKKFAEGRADLDQTLVEEQTKLQSEIAKELSASHANRFRLLEPRLFLRTTDHSLNAVGFAADRDQLAAFSSPPPHQSDAGVVIQIHESFISNIVSNPFKGDTYRSKDVPALVRAIAPDAEPVKMNEKDNFSITFDSGRPIQVRFDQGQITMLLAASQFRNAGTLYRTPFFIIQKFDLVKSDGLKLVGIGAPKVEFQDTSQKSAGEVAFRKLLQDRIGEALKESGQEKPVIELPPNLIPERVINQLEDPTLVEALRLAEFESNQGWLTIGYNLDPNARLPEPTNTQRPVHRTVRDR